MTARAPSRRRDGAPSPIPLYHQVAQVLRQRIVNGTYEVGARLAAEDNLAAEFSVARATIRQAVGELVDSGLLSREQGRGTFVLDVTPTRFGVTFRGDLDDLILAAERNIHHVRELAIERSADPPPDVLRLLALERGPVTLVQRTVVIGDTPFVYHVNYLPNSYGALLTRTNLKQSGIVSILAHAGVDVHRARQSITARSAEPTESAHLGIALGSAVLVSERCLFDSAGTPVELNRAWYPGDIYEYVVDFDRQRGTRRA